MSIVETLVTKGSEETEDAAARLALGLAAGDIIFLRGDLGGGKTTWVRGLVRGLGHPEPKDVASPTFALVHVYEGARLDVHHLDLYRLEGGPALLHQGVLDPLIEGAGVSVVEWAERLGTLPIEPALEISFEFLGETTRHLVWHFREGRGHELHRTWKKSSSS